MKLHLTTTSGYRIVIVASEIAVISEGNGCTKIWVKGINDGFSCLQDYDEILSLLDSTKEDSQ